MSKMNELWLEENYGAISENEEAQKQILRIEGAEELRKQLADAIKAQMSWHMGQEMYLEALEWVLTELESETI